MPVLGHAFAGLVMGEVVAPGRAAPRPARGLWVPLLVGLARGYAIKETKTQTWGAE